MYIVFDRSNKDDIFSTINEYRHSASNYTPSIDVSFEYWYIGISFEELQDRLESKFPNRFSMLPTNSGDAYLIIDTPVLLVNADYINIKNDLTTEICSLLRDTFVDKYTKDKPLIISNIPWEKRSYNTLFNANNTIYMPVNNTITQNDALHVAFNGKTYDLSGESCFSDKLFSYYRAEFISAGYTEYINDALMTLLVLGNKRKIFLKRISKKVLALFKDDSFRVDFFEKLLLLESDNLTNLFFIKDTNFVADNLIEIFQKKNTQELTELKKEQDESVRLVENYIERITSIKKKQNTLHEKEAFIKLRLAHTRRMKNSIKNELDKVLDLPYIKGIQTTSNNSLLVYTEVIPIDGVVPLGPYKVTLDIEDASIKVCNTANPKNHYDHPHVSSGNPCWGNYNEILVHLSKGEILTTMELLHIYLSSWNPTDDWGSHLIYWDPKHTFEVFEEMGILYRLRDYRDIYREIFDREMEGYELCSNCSNEIDECTCYCVDCGEHIDDCRCNYCETCDEHIDDCQCYTCEECYERVEDVCEDCYRCIHCGCVCEDVEVDQLQV